jgi:hypothetical protein
MPEGDYKRERPSSLWIPFRSHLPQSTHRIEHNAIAWSPSLIPEGQQLEIDVNGINRLIRHSQLTFPIEIWSYNDPREDDVELTGRLNFFGGVASIALENVSMNTRKPLNLADFSYDKEGNRGIMRINFGGISDYVANSLPEGRRNPRYPQTFGTLVNKAFRSQMGQAINTNYALFIDRSGEEADGEFDGMSYGLLPLAGGTLFAALQLILYAPGYQTAIFNFLNGVVWFEGVYMIHNTVKMLANRLNRFGYKLDPSIKSNSYYDSLWNKLLGGKLDEKLQFLYPHNTSKFFLIPYAVNFTWRDQLIRGKNESA